MSARTDNATAARELVKSADLFSSKDWPIRTGEDKADVLALAQVHATLALAEQQRIANLLTVHALEVQAGRREVAAQIWANHIREGVGL